MEKEIIHFIECPHCKLLCEIHSKDIKCKIFRHAVFKDTLKFIDPHASKETCDKLVQSGKVWGCAKPFFFDGHTIKKCDYI
jgi:hypothetical protein